MQNFSSDEWSDWFDQIEDETNTILALANAKCAEKFGINSANPDRVLMLASIIMQRHCAGLAANTANETL